MFTLDNDTLLGSFLAHIQANVRHMAALQMVRDAHPDADGVQDKSVLYGQMRELWNTIRKDIGKVYGLTLIPFNELALRGEKFYIGDLDGGPNPLRKTIKVVKHDMDKARRKDPSIKLLALWDIQKHTRSEDEKWDRQEAYSRSRGW